MSDFEGCLICTAQFDSEFDRAILATVRSADNTYLDLLFDQHGNALPAEHPTRIKVSEFLNRKFYNQ